MADLAEGATSHLPVGLERGRQRYVTAFALGYFFLCQVGGPLLHFAFNPGMRYWQDPLALLAHAVGIVVIGMLVLAPQRANMAAYFLIWATWATVWAAVIATLGTVHAERVPYYLAAAPLLAGLLLSARHVVIVGGLSVFGVAVLGGQALIATATAMNAGLLTIAATLVLGIGAYTRQLDEAIIGGQARQLVSRTTELEAIMNAASEGMVAVDGAGRIVNANPASVRLAGVSRLARGELMQDCLPEPLAVAVAGLQEAGNEGAVDVTLGDRILRARLRSLAGVRHGHLVTFQDVTEERSAQEQRHLAEMQRTEIEKLQEVTRFKSNLLNAASHELNTPLTPVRLQMELLRSPDRGPLTPKQLHSLDILDRNIQRLSAMITDILDVAKLDGARLPLRCTRVPLHELLQDEVAVQRAKAERRGLTIAARLDGQATVWGDQARLSQVIANLINNAIKFTPAGHVSVTLDTDDGWVAVGVEDTGIGIPVAAEAHLFEPFSQLHETGREAEGAGMGLYLCKGIVEAHGGVIGYDRRDGGSRFWFRMPTDALETPAPGQVMAS